MLNCKVRCMYGFGSFTTGKIYNIVSGSLELESDVYHCGRFKSIEEINEHYVSQFELWEEENTMLSCTVRCTNDFGAFVKGRMYSVVDGSLCFDSTGKVPFKFASVKEINDYFGMNFELVNLN